MGNRHIMQFFTYEHLPPHLQPMSKLFALAARRVDALTPEQIAGERELIRHSHAASLFSALRTEVDNTTPANPEATWAVNKITDAASFFVGPREDGIDMCLRLLLEAKDCAVRAVLAK